MNAKLQLFLFVFISQTIHIKMFIKAEYMPVHFMRLESLTSSLPS